MVSPYVFKFGGTSLGSAADISNAVGIVARFDEPLVVVTSALEGVTDSLTEVAAGTGGTDSIGEHLRRIHLDIAGQLKLPRAVIDDYRQQLDKILAELDAAATRSGGETNDLILATGERLSTPLVAAALKARGVQSTYVDSRSIVRTGSQWGQARVDLPVTREQVGNVIGPLLAAGRIPIVSGFLGSNEAGATTTLGRNGSDYTATILGACLEAREVWIWTDVDGVYTADPQVYPGAKLLPEISFLEAAEAAYFGARVIHANTFWPLLESESLSPVRIKNTAAPERPGTLICSEPKKRGEAPITTAIEGVSILTISGYGMVGVPGVAAKIFAAVGAVGTNVYIISQSSSERNLTLLVSDDDVPKTVSSLKVALADWIEKDHWIDRIKVTPGVAAVTVVGENMRGRYGLAGKIFSALGRSKINVIAIAQGSSEYSISMVVDADRVQGAIEAIHRELDRDEDGV